MASWIAPATSARGKHLPPAQNLNELPPALLLQTGLQQASKLGEHRGQGPALERRGLIQGPGLARQQSRVVQRIKHEVAVLIEAPVPRDDLAGVGAPVSTYPFTWTSRWP